jgi:tRNA threonylcarbamoyladenosine biosynthesis protein TsaB
MKNYLPILAIETSDIICGACVYYDDAKYFSSKIVLKHSHSEKLFEVINSVLAQAEIKIGDIRSLAVSAGPGSFTGLRIGMAAAKGIAEPLGLPVIPVPTFESLALQISEYLEKGKEFIIVNKVGKDELYFGKFQIRSNNYIFQRELKIIPNDDFDKLSDDMPVFGNYISKDLNKAIKAISSPDPEYVARWAMLIGKDKLVHDFDFLEPNYLKEFIVKEKKL